MKKLLLLTFLYLMSLPVFCQQSYWQQQVNYEMEVSLDDTAFTLDGNLRMNYQNNSPDTLYYIWIHLWPNAYKNDKTAFSDQLLENGRTDFYFSEENQRGYINRLNFKAGDVLADMEDHPQHQDITKLLLPSPLPPGKAVVLTTPFHVQLPHNFSRGGHIDSSFQITQWYPKPAVYDRQGWHAMPYLDQGEFYSEFGDYEVRVKVPEKYTVAATGLLVDQSLDKGTRTLLFRQANVHDFAWFASKAWVTKQDTMVLNNRVIQVYAHFRDSSMAVWKNSIDFAKSAIRTKSEWLGAYPYDIVSLVEKPGGGGGMEYPTITLLSTPDTEKMMDYLVNHEVGHNWFYGILASNERQHPWMDEGMNSYYDRRYMLEKYGNEAFDFAATRAAFIRNRLPRDLERTLLQTLAGINRDQPIETTSEAFSAINYNVVAYTKTALWLQLLEKELGTTGFDAVMRGYYDRWKFKHPYPEDFKKTAEDISGKDLSKLFALLYTRGSLEPPQKKDLRFSSFFSLKDTDKHNYVFISPAAGYNFYDKFMLGALFHNYTLPFSKFQFFAAPLYATGSKQFNGLGRLAYNWYPGDKGQQVQLSVALARFTGDSFTDSTGTKNYQPYTKIVPALRYVFANKSARSSMTKYLQWKTFLFRETGLQFSRDPVTQADLISYPVLTRYVNQLRFVMENHRVLYPFRAELQADQGDGFVRATITSNYYFNYPKGGGLNLRLFAGKFFYTTDRSFIKQYETDIYHLNMSGAKGYEDYTYSNYFFGRNEFEGFSNQQIMIRDGGFKVRTDLLSNKIGRTDDWLAALNLDTDIPKQINPLELLPIKIPVKIFADIGTYAGAWQKNAATGRFLYDAGLQVSLLKNTINIYFPILYSKVYDDYFKSTITEKRFTKNISFSIDVQRLSLKKLFPQVNF